MRMYKVTAETDAGPVTQFAPSQTEASKLRTALMEAHGLKRAQTEAQEVDVPTTKTGLIDFLNAL